jgi:DNA-binding response OmpR family regulator
MMRCRWSHGCYTGSRCCRPHRRESGLAAVDTHVGAVFQPLVLICRGSSGSGILEGSGARLAGQPGGAGEADFRPKGKPMRVLLVEDHVKLATTVAGVLRREGISVDLAFDGQDALDHVIATDYDVIVLDRDLPKVHGDDVCRSLVSGGSQSRILMLTAASTIEDRVDGLGIGADDYLPKPFAMAELAARIRALARRTRPALPPVLVRGDLQLDSVHRVATRNGQRLDLRLKEFAVLELLLAAQGAVVSADELMEKVWDEMADPFTSTVRVTVSRLRAKLGDPPVIETVSPVGYRI